MALPMLSTSATASAHAGVKVKSYTVSAGAGNTAVAMTADTELINGLILGAYYACPTNDPDQHIANVSLAASTGVVSIRLAANTTADVVINVVVSLASGNIA